MRNIFTYLKWRGDLNFQERPFCEADNLALALLSYADLKGCVPSPAEGGSVCIREAWEQYRQKPHADDHTTVNSGRLLEAMAAARRFQNARLSGFQAVLDEEIATQFAALQIELEDGTVYVSYRGTDETIVGWREDFRMGFEFTPAQELAAEYLRRAIRPGVSYRVGGHSKGGNLAEYAAIRCPAELREQIMEVWCNDSPGLCRELISEAEVQPLREKIIRILPGFSVIGTLFLYDAPSMIVESSAEGLLQHDAYTWCIEGDRFCRRADYDPNSTLLVGTFDQWIESADLEQRRTFTRDFFDALGANGARTLPEVSHGGIDGFGTVLLSLVTSESKTKIVVLKFIRSFFQNCARINVRQVLKDKAFYRGALLFLLGFFCVAAPGSALRVVGGGAGLLLFLWSLRKLYTLVVAPPEDMTLRKRRFALYVLLLCGAGFYMMNQNVVMISAHLLLAAALLLFAYRKIRSAMQSGGVKWLRLCRLATAILACGLSIAAAALAGRNIEYYILGLGSFVLLYGGVIAANALYLNGKWNQTQMR